MARTYGGTGNTDARPPIVSLMIPSDSLSLSKERVGERSDGRLVLSA